MENDKKLQNKYKKNVIQWVALYKQLLEEINNVYIKHESRASINHIQLEINMKDIEETLQQTKNIRLQNLEGLSQCLRNTEVKSYV